MAKVAISLLTPWQKWQFERKIPAILSRWAAIPAILPLIFAITEKNAILAIPFIKLKVDRGKLKEISSEMESMGRVLSHSEDTN